MIATAVFLTLLSLALLWLNVALWRSNPLGLQPRVDLATGDDELGPVRLVALLALVGTVVSAAHVWYDRVLDYSDEELYSLVQRTATRIDELDPQPGGLGVELVEEQLAEEGDLDRMLVVPGGTSLGSDEPTIEVQISGDDGGVPVCLAIDLREEDGTPDYVASASRGVC